MSTLSFLPSGSKRSSICLRRIRAIPITCSEAPGRGRHT
jgi:hypothetical protein